MTTVVHLVAAVWVLNDSALGRNINSAQAVIEDQDAPGVMQQCSSDRCALTLTAAERDSSLANFGGIALRKRQDIIVQLCGLRSL